jgi:hypothetical protein
MLFDTVVEGEDPGTLAERYMGWRFFCSCPGKLGSEVRKPSMMRKDALVRWVEWPRKFDAQGVMDAQYDDGAIL